MTFFNEKGLVVPREMNNIKIVNRTQSGRRSASSARSHRSISQHSQQSMRSFRATHKRPSMTQTQETAQFGAFFPDKSHKINYGASGAKFAKT